MLWVFFRSAHELRMGKLTGEEKNKLSQCLHDFQNNNLFRKVVMKDTIISLCKIVQLDLSDEEEFDLNDAFKSLPKKLLEVIFFQLLSPLNEPEIWKENIFKCLAQLLSLVKVKIWGRTAKLYESKSYLVNGNIIATGTL
jgi:hypothetical protein